MQWAAFKLAGTVYDLAHMDDFVHTFTVSAAYEKPETEYQVDVTFSLHCFTSALPRNRGPYDRALLYYSVRETRLFNQPRYDLSFQLPNIIRSMLKRKCRHTGHGNFYTVQLIDSAGQVQDYDVFFTVTKSATPGRLTLFVQSAFLREEEKLPPTRPIRFEIILFNVLNNKPLRD